MGKSKYFSAFLKIYIYFYVPVFCLMNFINSLYSHKQGFSLVTVLGLGLGSLSIKMPMLPQFMNIVIKKKVVLYFLHKNG